MHIEASTPYSYTRKCFYSEKRVPPCLNHPVLLIFSLWTAMLKEASLSCCSRAASLHFQCVCRSVEHKLWTQLQGLWNKSFPCLNINEFRKQFFPRPKPRHEIGLICCVTSSETQAVPNILKFWLKDSTMIFFAGKIARAKREDACAKKLHIQVQIYNAGNLENWQGWLYNVMV